MAVLKCKMCGGSLDVTEGMTVCECEYCGTMQTIPAVDDEKKINLFTRANRLRAACDFDKAASVYENIVSNFPEEAEAYWGLILCKFGIEYVDDPATGKKIPTCHRSSFESIMDDSDFELCMENADPVARRVYRDEAKTIDGIQKGILEISGKEEPYDIFICYKETDDNGERTVDSVIAQNIYDMLTENKYRVFFARISLEDKLGTAYEPYIFAALNSARIMLAVGTDYEYYNAVWVKNEWSRFLAMMSKDKKKVLIPCYKDIDAYDIPKEFKHLQAQDMGKVGAMQDLLRGIKKILPKEAAPVVQQVAQVVQAVQPVSGGANVNSFLQRAFMFLEDGDWQSADQYCEKVLDIDPQNGEAYLGKLMAKFKVRHRGDLADQNEILSNNNNFKKAVRFGSDQLITEINGYNNVILERCYSTACKLRDSGEESEIEKAAGIFKNLTDYKDSADQIGICRNTILEQRYQFACKLRDSGEESKINEAARIFGTLQNYKGSSEQIEICKNIILEQHYQLAYKLRDSGEESKIQEAAKIFGELQEYKDSTKQIEICRDMILGQRYQLACTLRDSGEESKIKEAAKKFGELQGYKDSTEQIEICRNVILEQHYQKASSLMESGELLLAEEEYIKLKDYKDSPEKARICNCEYRYNNARTLQKSFDEKKLAEAAQIYTQLSDYKDSKQRAVDCTRLHDKMIDDRHTREEKEAAKVWESSGKKSNLLAEQASLQIELFKLNEKLFAGKRRKEIEFRLAQIEDELRRL